MVVMEIAANCKDLRNISLSGCNQITEQSVGVLTADCIHLESLKLAGCNGIHSFANLQLLQLKNLDLTNCQNLTDYDFSLLHLATLESLKMDQNSKIGDTALYHISQQCSRLQDLSLSECGITDFGLGALRECTSISTLKISSCTAITDGGLLQILVNLRLIHLNASECPLITTEPITAALDSTSNSQCRFTLRSLNLTNCQSIRYVEYQQLQQMYKRIAIDWK